MKEQVLNGVYPETTKAFTDFGANPFEGANWNGLQRATLLKRMFAKAHHNCTPTYARLTPPKLPVLVYEWAASDPPHCGNDS